MSHSYLSVKVNETDKGVKITNFNKDLEEALFEAKEMRKQPKKYKSFNSVKELMEELEE